ncbi:MAG: zinc-ribbon domain-containing protein, partial [Candidatus Hodarchaeota archaeon]
NIQVFGNDSLGIYVSKIQHFSINSSPAYIPPDNSLIIILSVAIGVFIAVFGIVLAVILTRKKRYEADKFKEPKKPEIRFKPKFEYLICPYCHNENLIKNNYCINCGASLSEFKPDNT